MQFEKTHTEQSGEQKTVNKGRLRETQEQRNKVENLQRTGEATTDDLSSNTLGIFFFFLQTGLFSFCSLKKSISFSNHCSHLKTLSTAVKGKPNRQADKNASDNTLMPNQNTGKNNNIFYLKEHSGSTRQTRYFQKTYFQNANLLLWRSNANIFLLINIF